MKDKAIDSPVFMIGMPRSGTSILSEAISLHSDLGWLSNYLKWFWRYPQISYVNKIYSIGFINIYLRGKKKQDNDIISLIRRLLPYSAEMFTSWEYCCGEKFSMGYLINCKATEQEKKRVRKYVATVLKYYRKPRFFTKFTGPSRIEYLCSIFPDAFFIHIIRDPRAVVSSLIQAPFWCENGGLVRPWWKGGLTEEYLAIWEEYKKSPLVLAAIQWRRIVEIAEMEKKLISEKHYIEIKYEDFVNDPYATVNFLMEQCNLNNCRDIHRYLKTVGKLKNMNYKYREKLSRDEIKIIEDITRSVAAKKGYEF